VWSGWVGIAQKTGFGLVSPLPGILPSLHLDTSITLPVGVEAYAAYALRAWLADEHSISGRTRRFAKWSAICSFALGMAGQVAYHLLAQAGAARAPWPVTMIVSCLPVLVLAMGTALAHMLRADAAPGHGTRGPAADRPPARFHEDQAGLSPDQTASAGTPAETGPAARTATVPRQDHRPGPRTKAPRQTAIDQARLIACRLAAAGKPVSRRALRSEGIKGSNQALNALARRINAELADAATGSSSAPPGCAARCEIARAGPGGRPTSPQGMAVDRAGGGGDHTPRRAGTAGHLKLATRASQLASPPVSEAQLDDAADFMVGMRAAWHQVDRMRHMMITESRLLPTPVMTDVSDLVLRMGRLVWDDPHWTPAHSRLAPMRNPAALAPGTDAVTTIVTAVHQSVDVLARAGKADMDAVEAAGQAGRLYVPTRSLSGDYDIPGPYATAPVSRCRVLQEVYRVALDASIQAVRALDELAVAAGASSKTLALAWAAAPAQSRRPGSQPGPDDGIPGDPRPAGIPFTYSRASTGRPGC
jgi:hypothetical protein